LEEVLLFAGRVPVKIKVCMNATLVRPHGAAFSRETEQVYSEKDFLQLLNKLKSDMGKMDDLMGA
jgi:hypothetical protein